MASTPLFAAYSLVTNWALGHVESMQELAELRRFTERIELAEEEYQPSAPPMSPITRSFFWHWALYDLTIGVKKETLGQVLLAVGRHLRMDPLFLGLLERLSESRVGLYVHEGTTDGHLRLRELATGAEHLSECTCTHEGVADEVWLVRLAPSPGPAPLWTMLTTPYVIAAPDITGWRSYFDRVLPKTSDPTRRAESYARFMKHGPEGEHWNDYVFRGVRRARRRVRHAPRPPRRRREPTLLGHQRGAKRPPGATYPRGGHERHSGAARAQGVGDIAGFRHTADRDVQ